MADFAQPLLQGGEAALNQLLGEGGTSAGSSASPAGSTPALSGSAQPQAPNNGQGVPPVIPVNYVPWAIAGAVLLSVLVFVVVARK